MNERGNYALPYSFVHIARLQDNIHPAPALRRSHDVMRAALTYPGPTFESRNFGDQTPRVEKQLLLRALGSAWGRNK